jgi:hypothetical protein
MAQQDPGPLTHAADVAKVIWQAVCDPSTPVRTSAGADTVALAGVAT